MAISVVGLSYKTAPVEIREKLHISEDNLPGALHQLKSQIPEALLFSTCNRFELITNHIDADETKRLLVEFISDYHKIDHGIFEQYLYCHLGTEAVRHVFRVTSSLDSMIVGEPQILGQVKTFYSIAQNEHTIGSLLNTVMERAFAVAKKVRTETLIATNAISVSSVAVELANKIFGDLDGKTAFIIGAGKMSLLAIRHLQSRGIKRMLVTNRTFSKAAELAQEIQARAVPFESLVDCLPESDIVISSTGSRDFIIRKEDAVRALSARKNKPIFFIDIAVPRDIDPQINEIDNTFLYDIDDLKTVADANRRERQKEAERAEEIIQKESELLWGKLKSFDIAPTIREIQSKVDELRQAELQRTLKRLGPLSDEQKSAVDQLTVSLTNKLVQSSFAELRQLVRQPDGIEKIELIKKLFRLS